MVTTEMEEKLRNEFSEHITPLPLFTDEKAEAP